MLAGVTAVVILLAKRKPKPIDCNPPCTSGTRCVNGTCVSSNPSIVRYGDVITLKSGKDWVTEDSEGFLLFASSNDNMFTFTLSPPPSKDSGSPIEYGDDVIISDLASCIFKYQKPYFSPAGTAIIQYRKNSASDCTTDKRGAYPLKPVTLKFVKSVRGCIRTESYVDKFVRYGDKFVLQDPARKTDSLLGIFYGNRVVCGQYLDVERTACEMLRHMLGFTARIFSVFDKTGKIMYDLS